MLNRTNRTLSANLHRLNLGTRSLVLVENVNSGKSTLRIHHDHDFAMRARMFASSDPAIRLPSSRIRIPSILGSTSVVTWPVAGPVVRPPASESVTSLANSCADYAQSVLTLTQSQADGVKPKHKSSKDLHFGMVSTVGVARDRVSRYTAASAIVAAAAGG